MAYKNASYVLLVALAATTLVASTAVAQRGAQKQALWRVIADSESGSAPAYSQQKTPFPVKEAPVIVVPEAVQKVQRTPVISPEEMAERARTKKAAGLLGDIRRILKEESIFDPDVGTITVNGRILGDKGYRVLVNGTWIGKGDIVTVPVVANEEVWILLDSLSVLDERLAGVVKGQVEEKVDLARDLNLTIKEITSEQVFLEDEEGRAHSVNF